jgi:hypothetical protein
MLTVVPALNRQRAFPLGAVIVVCGSEKVITVTPVAVVKSPAPNAPLNKIVPVPQLAPVPDSNVAVSAVVPDGAIVKVAPQTYIDCETVSGISCVVVAVTILIGTEDFRTVVPHGSVIPGEFPPVSKILFASESSGADGWLGFAGVSEVNSSICIPFNVPAPIRGVMVSAAAVLSVVETHQKTPPVPVPDVDANPVACFQIFPCVSLTLVTTHGVTVQARAATKVLPAKVLLVKFSDTEFAELCWRIVGTLEKIRNADWNVSACGEFIIFPCRELVLLLLSVNDAMFGP